MSIKQGNFYIDDNYYKALKVIADEYNLSISSYVAKIIIPIIRQEMVDLGITPDEFLSASFINGFIEQEVNTPYKRPGKFASKFTCESKQDYSNYINYLLNFRNGNYQAQGHNYHTERQEMLKNSIHVPTPPVSNYAQPMQPPAGVVEYQTAPIRETGNVREFGSNTPNYPVNEHIPNSNQHLKNVEISSNTENYNTHNNKINEELPLPTPRVPVTPKPVAPVETQETTHVTGPVDGEVAISIEDINFEEFPDF